MELLFLGTGTSHGVPMIGCDCEVCRSSDPRDRRGRASILLSWDGRNVVVDTGAEFRRQILTHRVMTLDAVLYTHAHADHIHGIDDLRGFTARMPAPMPVYADSQTCAFLRRTFRYIFEPEAGNPNLPSLDLRAIQDPFELFGETVTPTPILHGRETVLGFRVGGMAYLTDCSGAPKASRRLLDGLDTLVVGALRAKPHPKHFSVGQALDFIAEIRPRRAFLTHLAHRMSHRQAEAMLPPHVEMAYDGLRVRIP